MRYLFLAVVVFPIVLQKPVMSGCLKFLSLTEKLLRTETFKVLTAKLFFSDSKLLRKLIVTK